MNATSPPGIGEIAGDFTLPDGALATHRLSELCADRRLVLVFYRGHW